MAIEIERKFLVTKESWREHAERSRHIVDHLIARFSGGKARIRLCDDTTMLTFKGARRGLTRREYHIPLNADDAADMISEFAAAPALEKLRHDLTLNGLTWQVDEFLGALSGLVTADVELPTEAYDLTLPEWAGDEITGDPRFSSGTLASALQNQGVFLRDVLSAVGA